MENRNNEFKVKEICCEQEMLVFGCSIQTIPPHLINRVPAARYVAVTDSNVYKLYGNILVEAFEKVNINLYVKIIEPGEAAKSRRIKEEIEDWMFSLSCNRDTCMVAIGGGVVGDLTGFVAATYLRSDYMYNFFPSLHSFFLKM